MQLNKRSGNDSTLTVTTLLGWLAVSVGGVILFTAVFLDTSTVLFPIFVGLGVTLFPAGIFTLLSDYNFKTFLLSRVHNIMDFATEDLKHSIDTLNRTTSFLEESKRLGLACVYPDRPAALEEFLNHAEDYVSHISRADTEQLNKAIIVVASSLKGIWDNPHFADKLSS